MNNRFLFSLLGIVLGFFVTVNWLLWRAFSSEREWWTAWFQSELEMHSGGYFFLVVGSVTVFALLGFFLGRRSDELKKENETVFGHNLTLSELATTDQLTGLFNMRYVHDRLDEEIGNSFRSPLTCLLVDIDHFKRINDTHGHPFGDVVLADIARILKKNVRRIDIVGRMGGEEFIIVMPDTSKERALAIGDRIREAIQEATFNFEEKRVLVTVSLGVVTYPSPKLRNKEDLLKAVDDALYEAKRAGRNRVVVWEGISIS